MRKGYPLILPPLRSHFIRSGVADEIEVTGVVVTPTRLSPPKGGERKRMGSLARSKSLNLEARRVILMMWPMPLGSGPIVSLITVNTMRIPTLCPFTFWEQQNMVKNLCQGACEDATNFMIRVGSSISNLAKDWKGQLTEAELQSLQYEVSLNGVREEIWHVLDSEIARQGQLTPHQMYEAVKRYETYIACNKCLKGRSASPHIGHQRAAAQTSGYKPHFHKTTTFTASVEESADPPLSEQGPPLPKGDDHLGGEPIQEEDEGLYIPSFLEEALGGDGNLQIKMAHTIQAQERHDKNCLICQSGDHIMKDHYKEKNGMGLL